MTDNRHSDTPDAANASAPGSGDFSTDVLGTFRSAGDAAMLRKDYPDAVGSFTQAIEYMSRFGGKPVLWELTSLYTTLGKVFRMMRNERAAQQCWDKAARCARQAGEEYERPRYTRLALSATPEVLEVTDQVDAAEMHRQLDALAQGGLSHLVLPQLATRAVRIEARMTEANGRVNNAQVRFSVPKDCGAVFPKETRTKGGVAQTTFYAFGKTGSCVVTARDHALAEAAVEVLVSKPPRHSKLELAELRWINPGSAGLIMKRQGLITHHDVATVEEWWCTVGVEEVHWKKGGRPLIEMPPLFAARRTAETTQTPLEIELSISLRSEQGTLAMPTVEIRGDAELKPLYGDHSAKLPGLQFTGQATAVGADRKMVRVTSAGPLPDALGKYAVEIKWSYRPASTKSVDWIHFETTVNELFVTWKPSQPAVKYALDGFGEEIKSATQAPGVYLDCLEESTRAILGKGALTGCHPLAKALEGPEQVSEAEMLDRIFDHLCDAKPFADYWRTQLVWIWSGTERTHQSIDLLQCKMGDCGDWACLFHDMAAAQGIGVSINALGKKDGDGENFCMWPHTASANPVAPGGNTPIVYDPYRMCSGARTPKRMKGGGERGYRKEIADLLGITSESDLVYVCFH